MAIHEKKVEDYKEVARYTGDELFKLNLYPIAFDSTDLNHWHKYGLSKITGFENKYLFNTWCFFNRFPAYTNLRKKHKPDLIICTGVDYLRDFLIFFGTRIKRKKRNGTKEKLGNKRWPYSLGIVNILVDHWYWKFDLCIYCKISS